MANRLVIQGGKKLSGTVTIDGAKNSAVALIPAAIMADSEVVLEGLPNISDVHTLYQIIGELGGNVRYDENQAIIDPSEIVDMPLPNGNVKKLRASYYLMGALLGKFKKAVVGLPGGCYLGPRPIDQHIKGFEALGATVTNEQGAIYLRAEKLRGARIYLDVVSVGATINIMLAAVLAEGKTVIENAAKEPEIIDVATLLNNMGANIKGAGTDTIRIQGVEKLSGCKHAIIPDRIEAGTYMIVAAAAGSGVKIQNVIPDHLEGITAKLSEMGVPIDVSDDSIYIGEAKQLSKVDVKTYAYPGFATDLQQPMTALLTQAEGSGIVTDTVYSDRFKQIAELERMGGKFKQSGRSVVIYGKTPLKGTKVTATDLRAGAALIIAGLVAEGTTEILEIEHIERGYGNIVEKLTALGADIRKESGEPSIS
ncbi:UDP-N-acetylglucosamine 1-carboxyvinyltransferase [Listeria aquatica]|uniref:UDP-N-acetylglucosamine 1-carboxyvinyltransferase n=1 Tax=Listeria aquatica TaxID=1494960 RepID=A0A841ZMI0_9LIST|nr:UDP-N-acetylglucosamine 1-carboxyvinyltransferase [Listeria aquatica]MBC1521879.1 UDP-N-acetylglucosamine 1-carboxyvinyltransferase [Listeria aquatica]